MNTDQSSHSISSYRSGLRRREKIGKEYQRRALSDMSTQRSRRLEASTLTRGLGWFSVALGTAELLFPRSVNRLSGVSRDHAGLTRLFGLRELTSGLGILNSRPHASRPWIQARIAGDALDLATLGLALFSPRNRRSRTLLAITAVAGVTALDVLTFRELQRERNLGSGRFTYGVPVEVTLIVNRPAQECYDFWRKLDNLPRFMRHLESVKTIDDARSHWVAKAPIGTRVEWDAEITEDRPGALLAWKSLPGSQIPNAGTVRFEEQTGGRGTMIHVSLVYDAPGGRMGATLARILGEEPHVQIREDLRRFKRLIETGEIPTTRGQPAGRRSGIARLFGKGETP